MYVATIFQENIATVDDITLINLVKSFNKSSVRITSSEFIIHTIHGKSYKYEIRALEKDFFTTTHIGKFDNGKEFRLIQPIGASLEKVCSRFNTVGAFTIGSLNTSGWAIHFLLTTHEDTTERSIKISGKEEQIIKLLEGCNIALEFGIPQKFIELSKIILQLISYEPKSILKFNNGEKFVSILKDNLSQFTDDEQSTILNI